jgi:transposase
MRPPIIVQSDEITPIRSRNSRFSTRGIRGSGEVAPVSWTPDYLGFEESTMGKTRAAYPPEFRRQMVDLVRVGRSPEELAREFEPTAQSIRNWLAQSERNAGRGDGGLTTAEREELNRLRRENRQLRLERKILSKAAAWFARETNTIPHKGSSS